MAYYTGLLANVTRWLAASEHPLPIGAFLLDAEKLSASSESPADTVAALTRKCDLMYNPRHHQHLADTLAMLSTIGSEVLWATRDGSPTRRSAARPFFYSAMETYGFVIHDITESAQVQAAMRVSFTEGPNCGKHSARGPLCVVKMVRDTVESSIVASKL